MIGGDDAHGTAPAVRLADAAATEAFGRALAGSLRTGDVVALFGGLGAGKTTLARGILQGLGHEGDVASPTFPIVVTYDPPDTRLPAWHVDLYRIEAAAELGELGLDEARADGVLLIEWPERLPALWPETLRLALAEDQDGGRALTAMVPPAWGARWPPRP
jgi:tRNA threonylcarbamoyladenosine biosynthesis protein TsaE